MPSGDLSERVIFSERAVVSDGYGGTIGEFADQFTVAAGYVYKEGREAVLAARLTGTQPIWITVRQSSDTDRITTDWQARDARDGTVFAIKSKIPNKQLPKINWDILAVSGEAA